VPTVGSYFDDAVPAKFKKWMSEIVTPDSMTRNIN
jgi:hypothetical protein